MSVHIEVTANVHSHGDGYLTVDTDEWLEGIGTVDDAATDSLNEFLVYREDRDGYEGKYNGYRYPHDSLVLDWARGYFKSEPSGLYGDGTHMSMATFNGPDNLLYDEIGAMWFSVDSGTYFVEQSRGTYGEYVTPTVYLLDVEDDSVDYDRCDAGCRNGHGFQVESATYLVGYDGSGPTIRIGDRARMVGDNGYIACPECNCKLSFAMNLS